MKYSASRLLKLVPFKSLGAVSYSLSIVTVTLSCISSKDKARYWSKLVIFFHHNPLHLTLPLGGTRRNIAMSSLAIPSGEKSMRIFVAVSTEYRRVTDRQTNGQTDGRTDRQ